MLMYAPVDMVTKGIFDELVGVGHIRVALNSGWSSGGRRMSSQQYKNYVLNGRVIGIDTGAQAQMSLDDASTNAVRG